MTSSRKCVRCDAPIPDWATIWWKCVCGFQQGISQPTFSQQCVKNAGTLTLVGLALGIVPSGLVQAGIAVNPVFFLPGAVTLVFGIYGFIKRGQTR